MRRKVIPAITSPKGERVMRFGSVRRVTARDDRLRGLRGPVLRPRRIRHVERERLRGRRVRRAGHRPRRHRGGHRRDARRTGEVVSVQTLGSDPNEHKTLIDDLLEVVSSGRDRLDLRWALEDLNLWPLPRQGNRSVLRNRWSRARRSRTAGQHLSTEFRGFHRVTPRPAVPSTFRQRGYCGWSSKDR